MAKAKKKRKSYGVPVVAQMRGSQVWVWVNGALVVFEKPLTNAITKYVAKKMGVPQAKVRPWVLAAVRSARLKKSSNYRVKKVSSFKKARAMKVGRSSVRYRVLRR